MDILIYSLIWFRPVFSDKQVVLGHPSYSGSTTKITSALDSAEVRQFTSALYFSKSRNMCLGLPARFNQIPGTPAACGE